MQEQKEILRRVYVVFFGLFLLASLILFKVVDIQVIQGAKWIEKASKMTTRYHNIEAVRGNIYASNGGLMATSLPRYEVRFDPNVEALSDEYFNEHIDSLAKCLGELFEVHSAAYYKNRLVSARAAGERYHLIARNANYNELKKIRSFPIFNRGRYKGGMIYIQRNTREKPFKSLASRTIGYEVEGIRPVGLEGAYSSYLSGVNGKRLMQKIAGGEWMPINDENEIEPLDGADVVTTINLNIQDVAHNALLNQLTKQEADHGTVVLMEVSTGDIKAIANLSRGSDGNYYERYNYAIGESTEPGSTFKLPVYMVALEDGHVDLEDTISTGKGSHKFYKNTMYDSRAGGYGTISVEEAFSYSSNIAVAKIINQNYSSNPQAFIDRLYKMNLNQPLGIEIVGEGKPWIKPASDKSWSGLTLPWMSTGYEVQMTPLQILTFYNAVANNGVMVKPKFVHSITSMGKEVKRFDTEVINSSIASESTIKKAQKMLESVVEYGTATNLKNANFKIAGKTGTAQIANSKYGYKYDSKVSYQASFCGYFPADNPKYTCIVVVNAPSRHVYYGNLVAGPIFKEIADKVYATSIGIHKPLRPQAPLTFTGIPVSKNGYKEELEMLFTHFGIPFENKSATSNWVITQTGQESVKVENRRVIKNLVPNVVGMSARDAIFLLENAGLRVELEGRGMVKRQSAQPGNKVTKGGTVKLELA